MAGTIKAGRAMVKVSADRSELNKGLKGAQRRLQSFGRSVTKSGGVMTAGAAAAIAPIVLATRQFAQFGDQVDKMSKRTGMAVGALSEIAFAAEQSGASLEDVEKGIRRMQRTVLDAKDGLSEAKDAFKHLGVTMEDMSGKTPEEQFTLILSKIKGITDPTMRAAVAMEIFGRSGTALIPMAEDFETLRAEAKALGITLSEDDAAAAAELVDSMNRVMRTIKAVSVAVGSVLAPVLSEIATNTAQYIAECAAWIKANKEVVKTVVKTVVKVIGVVGIAGAALLTLGTIAKGVAFAMGGLSIAIKGVTVAFTFLTAHPIVSLLTLIAAGIVGLVFAIRKWRNQSKEAGNAQDQMSDAMHAAEAAARREADAVQKLTGKYDDLAEAQKKAAKTKPSDTWEGAGNPGSLFETVKTASGSKRMLSPMEKLNKAAETYNGFLESRRRLLAAIERAQADGRTVDFETYSKALEYVNEQIVKGKDEVVTFIDKLREHLPKLADASKDTINAALAIVGAGEKTETKDQDITQARMFRDIKKEEYFDVQRQKQAEQDRQLTTLSEESPAMARDLLGEMIASAEALANTYKVNLTDAIESAWADSKVTAAEQDNIDQLEDYWGRVRQRRDELKERLANIGEDQQQKKNDPKVETKAVFNAVALFGMALGQTTDKTIADASKSTAKNTKDIADAVRSGGVVFA